MTKHLQNSSFQGLSVSTITFLRDSLPNAPIYYVHTLKDESENTCAHLSSSKIPNRFREFLLCLMRMG